MSKKFKPLYDDRCFNHVFSREEFAIDFINTFFNTEYKHENVKLRSEDVLPKTEYNDKSERCDIVALVDNVIYNLEAYTSLGKHELNKSKSYAFRIYGTQLKSGDEYLPKAVVQVNICGSMTGNTELSRYGLLDIDKKVFGILEDDFIIYFVNLDKIKAKNYNVGKNDKMNKYFRLFNAQSIKEMEEISEGDEIFMSITECLKEFLNDEETQKMFARDAWQARKNQEIGKERGLKLGEERGLKLGEERGLKLGEERGLSMVALNMLEANEPIEKIKTFTGLTEAAVLKLKKSMSKNKEFESLK